MKILLVQSYLGGSEPPVFPLGLSCIRAALKGHTVKGYDTNVSKTPYEGLKEIIREFSPDVIGVSLRNIDSTNKREVVFYYDFFRNMLGIIKECTNVPIIVGGSGFSMFARKIMDEETRIDYGVFLEGEEILPLLLDNLENPERVKGVFYRKKGRVNFSGAGKQADLNAARPPDREMMGISAYKGIPEAIGVETKRGCALRCIYCIYGFLNGRKYRLRDPKVIVDDIEELTRRGVDSFTFVDSVFNIPAKHSEEICREIIRRGLKVRWSAWFSENGLEEEFIKLSVKAGCKKIILSPDGFSDTSLKALEKNITKKDILGSYEMLKKHEGYEVCYNFFKNPPGTTLPGILSLAAFCVKAKREMGRRVHFEFNSMRVEPNTKLYEIAVRQGIVKQGEELLYPKYYTNPKTAYIEKAFNLALKLKGK